MTTILTTTGISLLINAKRDLGEKNPSDEQILHYLRSNPDPASAESKSLLKMASPGDTLVLLHTETPEAERCARLLVSFLQNQGFQTRLVNIKMREDEAHLETQGLRMLVNTFINEIEQAQRDGQEVIINATTGFKAQVVYSTMIGMVYQIPVKYIYEKFQNIVTFNPMLLDWDTSLILSYNWFFKWIDEEPRQQAEVTARLKAASTEEDQKRILSLLTSPDTDGHVFLSDVGEVLFRRFKREQEEASVVADPPLSDITDPDIKIANSILRDKHHYPKGMREVSHKIASIPFVRQVIAGHFENTTLSRIKNVSDDGVIRMLWADSEKAGNLTIETTAQGRPQTLKVANRICELLGIE
jgi:putative CRISPR-associated protein (TIGR02619 family)